MFCPKCGTEFQSDWSFCAKCGTKAPKISSSAENPSGVSSDNKNTEANKQTIKTPALKMRMMMLAAILSVLIGGTLIASISAMLFGSNKTNYGNSASSTWTPRATPLNQVPTARPTWQPQGFKELTPIIAYQAIPVGSRNCGYSSAHSCYQIYVVTAEPCQVFIEVNFEVDGVVVDSSISSATIGRNQQAIMDFVSFKTPNYSGDKKVRITSAECY